MGAHKKMHTPLSEVTEQKNHLLNDDWSQLHRMECEVSRRLAQHPGVEIHDLVVHRLPQGVCLEGRVILHGPHLDLQALMQGISGLKEIRNHLLMTPEPEADAALCSSLQENRREYTEQGKIEPFDFPHHKISDAQPR